MELKRVDIKNFRSIRAGTIDFSFRCRILVGINESGKSNVLRAMSFLLPEVLPTPQDVRQERLDEDSPSEAYVRFVFELSQVEQTELHDLIVGKFLGETAQTPLIISTSKKTHSAIGYCQSRTQGLYIASLLSQSKTYTAWSDTTSTLYGGWYTLIDSQPGPAEITTSDGRSVKVSKGVFVFDEKLNVSYSSILRPAVLQEVITTFTKAIGGIVKSNLPTCIFWTYREGNLLPDKIPMQAFADSPDTCLPLRHMFELAGYTNIKGSIDSARKVSHGVRNLLNKVAGKTTTYIQQIWKDYKTVEIVLTPDGDNISASVKDKDVHIEFERRSEGFKRFVSFLLLVAAKVQNDTLSESILLLDEPEIGLHPSSARSLLAELIKIGEKNTVIFSTHSIFMIDREEIGRHILVKKTDEVSDLLDAVKSDVLDEEVIYKAINFTAFDILKPTNLVFEGWRDKRLFLAAAKRFAKDAKSKEKLDKTGLCHAVGVKDIHRVTQILELANRSAIVISDSDAAAKQWQRKFKADRYWGEWKIYSDIDKACTAITAEDFIKVQCFKKPIEKIRTTYSFLPDIDINSLSIAPSRLEFLNSWMTQAGIEKEARETALHQLKGDIFDSLKPSEIEDSYQAIFEGIIATLPG